MAEFITGVVERIVDGATYGVQVYDRWVTVRVDRGVAVRVFDYGLLSDDLHEGQHVRVVLAAFMTPSHWQAQQDDPQWEPPGLLSDPPDLRSQGLGGVISDLTWHLADQQWQHVFDRYQTSMFVRLTTPIGDLITGHMRLQREVDAPLAVGNYVTWEFARYDLMAFSKAGNDCRE